MKIVVLCAALLLTSCGVVTSQSIYEGVRAQQNMANVGAAQPPEKMRSYDAYEAEREKAKPQE